MHLKNEISHKYKEVTSAYLGNTYITYYIYFRKIYLEDKDLTIMKKYINYTIENINNNEVIAFDNHPVSYKIIDELYEAHTKISIISFSTDIIKYVAKYTNFNIIMPNGKVNNALHIITGPDVIQTFEKYHIRYYFATAPYMVDNALYQTLPEIAEIQLAISNSTQELLLVNRPDTLKQQDRQDYSYIGKF